MSAGAPERAAPGAVVWRGLRRVLATLGIGVLATIAGSAAGGAWFALMAIGLEGGHGLMASPGIVFFGLIFGPLYAAPITLGVLPAIRLWLPRRWEKGKGMAMLLAGPLSGGGYLWYIMPGKDDVGVMGWVFLGAGTLGGLAAGLTFRMFQRAPAAGHGRGCVSTGVTGDRLKAAG